MQFTQAPATWNRQMVYENTMRHFFFEEQQNADAIFNDQHVKATYFEAAEEKDEQQENWRSTLSAIVSWPEVRRIRDWSHTTRHILKVLIETDSDWGNGLCMYLSFLGNYVGFYYINQSNPNNRMIKVVDRGQISYWPLTQIDEQLTSQLLSLVQSNFPGFKTIPPMDCSIEIRNLQLYERFAEKVEVFEAVFDANITGLF